jgi:hypothetical protein
MRPDGEDDDSGIEVYPMQTIFLEDNEPTNSRLHGATTTRR